MNKKCTYCKEDTEDYYMIIQCEGGDFIRMDKMCYACALVSRQLRFA